MESREYGGYFLEEKYKPKGVREAQRKLQEWDYQLSIEWNWVSDRWEIWHHPDRTFPYLVYALVGDNGEILVPGLGIGIDYILQEIRSRDFTRKKSGWFTRVKNNAMYDAERKRQKHADLWRGICKDEYYSEHADIVPRSFVPRRYQGGQA